MKSLSLSSFTLVDPSPLSRSMLLPLTYSLLGHVIVLALCFYNWNSIPSEQDEPILQVELIDAPSPAEEEQTRHDRGEAGDGNSHKLLHNNYYGVQEGDQGHSVTKPRRELQGGVRKGSNAIQAEPYHFYNGILRFPGVSFLPVIQDACLPESDPAYEAPNETVPFPNQLEFVDDTAAH